MAFDCPILFINYNRPQHTKRSLKNIARLKPSIIYIACDGPKEDDEDIRRNKKVKEVLSSINWECQVYKKYNSSNLGCKFGVSQAIHWFFENEDYGIIIEDDVIPSKDFFYFADEMLKKYASNPKVMHISANYFGKTIISEKSATYFSTIPHIWGWATWKSAWEKYTVSIDDFDEETRFPQIDNIEMVNYFKNMFQKVKDGLIDTWDYQWTYTIWKNEGLCLTPTKNLVLNIGYGVDATHTKNENDKSARIEVYSFAPPYILPEKDKINSLKDKQMFDRHFKYRHPNILNRVLSRLL